MEVPLVGTPLHRFQSMTRLRYSLTKAWRERRLLTAEERMAMLLNPDPFLWPNFAGVSDLRLTRNGMFFVATRQQFHQMRAMIAAINNRWLGYHEVQQREEKFVGISKTNKKRRREDTQEIAFVRYEVKGWLRLRRRTSLPCACEFLERAGFHVPDPNLLVFEYRMYPDILKDIRDDFVQAMEEIEEELRDEFGEEVVPPPLGPLEPPGLLNDEEMEAQAEED
ncbi:unnamed protein product [Alopecurus aequalis]